MYALFVDESEQGRYLGVGGFYAPLSILPQLEETWLSLKSKFHLDRDDEIKWTLPEKHPSREKLEQHGHKTIDLHEFAVDLIAKNDNLTLVVCVMVEKRGPGWRTVLRRRVTPKDFYCEGLKYVLQRFQEEALLRKSNFAESGPHIVIVDAPGLPKTKANLQTLKRLTRAIRPERDAPLRLYRELLTEGAGDGPQKLGNCPLRDLNFHSGLLFSHAIHHDLLQVSDVIIGCTTSWINDTARQTCSDWLTARVKQLSPRFRQPMFGNGLVIWPWQNILWQVLQASLR